MLNITPPNYMYCPLCGDELSTREEGGKDRKYCNNCGWVYYPHVVSSAGAIVVNDGNVLMVKRSIEPYKDSWMFPSGFVDFGEHPEETAIREVKEETGFDIGNLKFVAVEQAIDDDREPGHFYYIYKATFLGGDPVKDHENSEIEWIPIGSEPLIGWKIHKKYFSMLPL